MNNSILAYALLSVAFGGSSGGSGGGGVLIVTESDMTLDKTWQEINDAFLSGVSVYVFASNVDEEAGESNTGYSLVGSVRAEISPEWSTFYVTTSGGSDYSSTAASGYPQVDLG